MQTELPTYPARPANGCAFPDIYPAFYESRKKAGWIAEPKYNGWRAVIHIPTRSMWNRHGDRLSIEKEFAAAIDRLCKIRGLPDWIDAEALERRHKVGKGCLIVLDLIMPYLRLKDRRNLLASRFPELPLIPDVGNFPLLSCPPRVDIYGDAECWTNLQQLNTSIGCEFYEGVVTKDNESIYPFQLGSSSVTTPDWVKHKW